VLQQDQSHSSVLVVCILAEHCSSIGESPGLVLGDLDFVLFVPQTYPPRHFWSVRRLRRGAESVEGC